MITLFSLQCPENNLLRAVFSELTETCFQVPAPNDRHFEVTDEFARFPLGNTVEDDNQRILKKKTKLWIWITWI